MTKEQAGKIIRAMAADKNVYVRDCNTRVAKEDGKIIGAEYMYQKLHDILAAEVNSCESDTILATEVNSCESDTILKTIMDKCSERSGCRDCKYKNNDTNRCRLAGVPCEWGLDE